MDDQEAFSGLNIPKAWAVFIFVLGFLVVRYFPHDNSWVPTSDWIITPLCNIQGQLGATAALIAEKVQNILSRPEVEEDELRALLAYLTELIRWLRRLNFCFSFVLAHLNSIQHWGYDTYLYNHQQCELATFRLLDYYNTIERRLDINVVDGALG